MKIERHASRKWGVCPITEKLNKYTPGNWGVESIDCNQCPDKCEALKTQRTENQNGYCHGGSCYSGDGFSIFKHPLVLEKKNEERERQRAKYSEY
jgi:hypothetical protein